MLEIKGLSNDNAAWNQRNVVRNEANNPERNVKPHYFEDNFIIKKNTRKKMEAGK